MKRRMLTVVRLNSLMYCGLPVGAIFVAGLGMFLQDISWHTLVFNWWFNAFGPHSIHGYYS